MPNLEPLKCYCPACRLLTNHQVLFSVNEKSDDPEYWCETTYSVVKCMGCENIQFHKRTMDESNMYCDDEGEWDIAPEITTYPNRCPVVRPLYSTWHLPGMVGSLYIETMDCLNNHRLQLAAAGFRAIIEAICRDEKVPGKNLETMINNLAKAHIITAKDRDHLHAIRFMGNDSIHSLKKYREEEVAVVARIVNAVLTSLYLIEPEVRHLDEKPINTYAAFVKVLNDSITKRTVGQVDTLRNMVRHNRRIISEDIPKFEAELQTSIREGKYTKLSLCADPTPGRPQQYKIESV